MPHPAEPALRWAPERLLSSTGPRPGALLSNLRFLLLAPRAGRAAGPLAPAQPWRPVPAVAASLLAHLALILAVFLQPRPPAVERHLVFVREAVPIYWYGPPPRLRPAAPSRTPANFRAFHPHAMVWFAPPRPTNRWQTLIEPAAPPEAPRWVPPAQNIIAWPQPELPVLAAAGHALPPARSVATDAEPPSLRVAAPHGARLPLAAVAPPPPAVAAPHARRAASATTGTSGALPVLLGKAAPAPALIALSENPGPNPPPLGQATAPVAIGPRVAPDRPAAAPPSVATSWEPANLLVLLPAESAPPPPPAEPARPAAATTPPGSAARTAAPAFVPAAPPGRLPARDLLWLDRRAPLPADRPVGSLLVNMPNLTSAAGSWILKFFELAGRPLVAGHLEPPEPIRKVDPKYPPWLMDAGVEGDVLLDAVIEPDGSVRQIRVLRGLHPELDRLAAEAFARWQFRPALMDGEPVELEVLAQIPFRAPHRPGRR